MMSRLRREDGQVLVLVAAILVGIIGMTAFVVDVGSWFRQQRALQSSVDAAALAGAQALPSNAADAYTYAKDYAAKNGASAEITDANIQLKSTYATDGSFDTIRISTSRSVGGFFGGVLGVFGATVHAHATAMVGVPSEAQYVAPIAVNILHDDLTGKACGQQGITDPTDRICFGPANETKLPLGKTGAPGAFDLINLNEDDQNGTVGESTMASWIENGYSKYLPLGGYFSDPGAKYNGNAIDDALAARVGTDLLFPVYDTLTGTGSNASYHVVAWVGFHLEPGSYLQGSSGELDGYFTKVIWQGILPAGGGSTSPDLGDNVVALVD